MAKVCCGDGGLKSLRYLSVFLSAWADCVSLQTVCATCLCVLLLGYVSLGSLIASQDVFLSAWADCVSTDSVCYLSVCTVVRLREPRIFNCVAGRFPFSVG